MELGGQMTGGIGNGRGGRRTLPLLLGYAERVPLGERLGRYNEALGVLVVDGPDGMVPLVRAAETVLDETATKVRQDPADPSPPRRDPSGTADRGSQTEVRRAALDESETRVRAEATDPGNPRRTSGSSSALRTSRLSARAALDETKTSVRADPSDPSNPRRATDLWKRTDGAATSAEADGGEDAG